MTPGTRTTRHDPPDQGPFFARYATVKLVRRVRSRPTRRYGGHAGGSTSRASGSSRANCGSRDGRAPRGSRFSPGRRRGRNDAPEAPRRRLRQEPGVKPRSGSSCRSPVPTTPLSEPRRMGLVAEPRVGGRQILSVILPRRRLRLAAILSLAPRLSVLFRERSAGRQSAGSPPAIRANRKRIKDRLRLQLVTRAGRLIPEVFCRCRGRERSPSGCRATNPVTVIVPIYNAFELLAEMLDRVSRHNRPQDAADPDRRLLVRRACPPVSCATGRRGPKRRGSTASIFWRTRRTSASSARSTAVFALALEEGEAARSSS